MEPFMNLAALGLILGYYLLINLALYTMMCVDKKRAQEGGWRVPEKKLFFLAILGGSLGGLIAMFTKRHKNRHPSFVLVYTVTFFLHFLLMYHLLDRFVILFN